MLSRILATAFVLFSSTVYATTPPPYNRVLVPISVDDVPGAKDSLWTTELWGVNASAETVKVAALPCIIAPLSLCEPTFELLPDRSTKIAPMGTAEKPGVLLLVPAGLALRTAFTLHVRDLNRQSESWGAEIPVVRERDFFTASAHMPNVPFGGEYRQTLRIYALLETVPSARFRVKMYEVTGTRDDRLLRDDVVTLTRPAEPPPNRIGSPLAQIALTDMFQIEIGGVDRVRISIEPMTDPLALTPPVPYWAFVSITNNNTQQVTTVTPR